MGNFSPSGSGSGYGSTYLIESESGTLHQAVLETCSYPAVGVEGLEDENTITYRSYLPLWTGWLALNNNLTRRIYECFVASLVSTIDRLDLSVKGTEVQNGSLNKMKLVEW
jgi:hypothetical protein